MSQRMSLHVDYRAHQAANGSALIELMVAVAVSMVVLSGVLQVLMSSMQAYRVQDAVSRLENSGQYAIEFIARDVRNADFWGCVPRLSQVVNGLNPAGAGYNATYHSFTAGIAGTANTAGGGTDTLTLRGAVNPGGGNAVAVQAPYPTSSTSVITVGAGSGIASGQILLISNCNTGDIFQATSINGAGAIGHVAGSGSPGNFSASLSQRYTTQAFVYQLYTHSYALQTGSDGNLALFYTTDQGSNELVNNVQSMVVLYGVDSDNEGSANRYVRANAVTDMSQVVSLRISLLMQSAENNLVTQPQAYIYNGTTTTPADYRVRRVYTATVSLRNRSS